LGRIARLARRSPRAAAGSTTIDLVNSVDPKGVGTTYTEVGDGQSIYTLTPAPRPENSFVMPCTN
jgi:hypothetical protein